MPYAPGPFDARHYYVQWGGKLPGGEQWSCGVRLAFTGAADSTSDAAVMAGTATAVSAFHTTAGSMISQAAKLSFVKANLIGTDGHYVDSTTQQAIFADVGGPNSGDPLHPNQVAWAISWTTGFSRGPAHRGRMYLPLPSCIIDANGLVSTTVQSSVKTRAEALRTQLNAVRSDLKLAIFSRKLGAPTHRLVTGVEVGRVLDTQRRRRNKMAELYA